MFRFQGTDVLYVKRVVGLPGDRIQMIGGKLQINGRDVRIVQIDDAKPEQRMEFIETLPSGRAYHIIDSDKNGVFDNTDVFRVPPDQYFVLGDNRDNSVDSRSDVGYVPARDIVARPVMKYYDGEKRRWVLQPIEPSPH